MKIGLNAICLNDRPSGARNRFIGIYSEIFNLLHEHEFYIYEPSDCSLSSWFTNHNNNISFIKTNIPSLGRIKKIVNSYQYWKINKMIKFDLFEGYHLPFFHQKKARNFLTIHDIRSLSSENNFIDKSFHRLFLNNAILKGTEIITVSESMKNEILYYYPKANITVIPNGISKQSFNLINYESLLNFKSKFNINNDFLLSVGHLEKRKNYTNLIKSFSLIAYKIKNLDLVIIGNDSGEKLNLQILVNKLNLNNRVYFLNNITDIEVRCAYKLCKIFIFPSLYEGFGIPILEAMVAGIPMILSNIQVFKEITQNNGIYFEANDYNDLAFCIEKLYYNIELQATNINYGYNRVNDFSYNSIAQKVISLYNI